MKYQYVVSALALATNALAAPSADALPWAKANPQAGAAAQAYADAYAEAEAIGHADPQAYALAANADDCASIACHASCGLLIIEGQSCSKNTDNTYEGPYDESCLCSDDSSFMKYYSPCMDCGWTLWKYYGVYVESALSACGLSTEPTGTSRCSTTLTDEYTPDYNINGCTYLGNCADTTTSSSSTSSAEDDATSTSAQETSTTAKETSTSTQETSTTAKETSTSTQETSTTKQSTESSAKQTSAGTTTKPVTSDLVSTFSTGKTGSTTSSEVKSSTSAESSTHVISTFEGAAVKIGGAASILAAFAFLLF
jgi:hypothetical protein